MNGITLDTLNSGRRSWEADLHILGNSIHETAEIAD
jgi:hypothetical protein